MIPRDPFFMTLTELEEEAASLDQQLGHVIDLVRLRDAGFRTVLDRSLAVDAELERRKNR